MMNRARQLSDFRIARIAGFAIVLWSSTAGGQLPAQADAKPWTSQDDHKNMMEQLGIRALRPGPSGNEADPNHANYDEAKANPFPDLGRSDDYMTEKMPAVNRGLLDGQLAWRQHDGGHTDAPNWKYFIPWADRFFRRSYTPAPPVPAAPGGAAPTATLPQSGPWPADKPTPRTDSNSMLAHRQLLEKKAKGKIDVYFEGNSIVRRWGATDYPQMLASWNSNFFGWNAADFGWGADRIEHMLWRIENGELDGVNPKVIVLLAGTNNVGARPGNDAKVAEITRGIKTLIDLCQKKAPNATIILTGIFPRNDNIAVVPEINKINENIARFADGKKVRYVNINDKLADKDGVLYDGMTVDKLHPTVKGYQVWADALKPILTELLGPPASTDRAPPPTGDPSAKKPGDI